MPETTPAPSGPRTFISYSWSSPEHEDWVLRLATYLREFGVDVVLDKWDLREGDDAYQFMERIVTDPLVQKVVLVCDREYVRKADNREGGVGAEAQILTPELYRAAQKASDTTDDQKEQTRKFVAVVREHAKGGERSTPTFYGGRIHIDAAADENYGSALEQLTRWIYDKPVHEKPVLGKPPAFVTDINMPDTGTGIRQHNAIKALREGRPEADGAVDEYFETLAENLPRFDLDPDDATPIQQAIVERFEQLKPVRDEVVTVFQTLARYRQDVEGWESVHRLFQSLVPLLEPVYDGRTSTWARDHFKLFVPELFLYAIAILLQRRMYSVVSYLLGERFMIARYDGYGGLTSFRYLQRGSDALKVYYQDKKENWMSPEGNILYTRADITSVPFQAIMQADLVLALQEAGVNSYYWRPTTLAYTELRPTLVFEVFARSVSSQHFELLKPVLNLSSVEELRTRALAIGNNGHIFSHRISIPNLIGLDKIGTKP